MKQLENHTSGGPNVGLCTSGDIAVSCKGSVSLTAFRLGACSSSSARVYTARLVSTIFSSSAAEASLVPVVCESHMRGRAAEFPLLHHFGGSSQQVAWPLCKEGGRLGDGF